jgi:predicted DNA-binding transcriptional regulator AlpA
MTTRNLSAAPKIKPDEQVQEAHLNTELAICDPAGTRNGKRTVPRTGIEQVRGKAAPSPALLTLLTLSDLCHMTQYSRRKIQYLVSDGHLPPPLILGCRLPRWHPAVIEAWFISKCQPYMIVNPTAPANGVTTHVESAADTAVLDTLFDPASKKTSHRKGNRGGRRRGN